MVETADEFVKRGFVRMPSFSQWWDQRREMPYLDDTWPISKKVNCLYRGMKSVVYPENLCSQNIRILPNVKAISYNVLNNCAFTIIMTIIIYELFLTLYWSEATAYYEAEITDQIFRLYVNYTYAVYRNNGASAVDIDMDRNKKIHPSCILDSP